MTETFDDRLLGHDDVESLMDSAEEVARDLGEEHAPETHCRECVRQTPLSKEWARDIPKARKMENLDAEVRGRVKELDDTGSAYWVTNELNNVYEDAFYGELADVEDCEMRNEPGHAEKDF